MKRIARIFATKTKLSPTDQDAYFGPPPALLDIKYDEVHISITFTESRDNGVAMAHYWEKYGTIKIGGPACGDPGSEFIPGMYLKKGVTITSRGCIRNCPFCFVPKREGKLREIKIHPGNIVQDNNLLACSEQHIRKVFEMLRTQRAIEFSGGLDCRLLNNWIIDELRSLKIKQLWFAYDDESQRPFIKKTAEKLKNHFSRDKLRCYVLIGFGEDTLDKAEGRLRQAWDFGFLPFAMLYEPEQYTKDWYDLQRNFSRPAITKSIMCPKKEKKALFA